MYIDNSTNNTLQNSVVTPFISYKRQPSPRKGTPKAAPKDFEQTNYYFNPRPEYRMRYNDIRNNSIKVRSLILKDYTKQNPEKKVVTQTSFFLQKKLKPSSSPKKGGKKKSMLKDQNNSLHLY